MKNLLKLGCSFLVLCIFLLSSCTKEAPLEPKEQVDAPIPQSNEEIQICFENPGNPYEYVGEQHNLGLDAIAATPGFANLSLDQAHQIAQQQIESNLNVSTGVSYEDMVSAYDYIGADEPLLAVAQNLLDEGVISELAYNRLLELNQILDESEDPVSFGNTVIDLENEIMQETAYTTDELEIMLGACSIARHSACYWLNAALDSNNPWHPHLGIDANGLQNDAQVRWGWWKKVKRFFKKVIKFVKADISGYKYAKKVIGWFYNGDSWVPIVVSVVVGVVYSFIKIFI